MAKTVDESIAAWRRVIDTLGYEPQIEANGHSLPRFRVRMKPRGPFVVVAAQASRRGKFKTLLQAPAVGALGFHLKATIEDQFSSIGRLFGLQDIQVGESTFDKRYLIRANDEALTQLWLNEGVRKRILQASEGGDEQVWELEIESETVSLSRRGLESDPDRLIAAIEAVDAVARRGRELGVEISELAEALGGRAYAIEEVWRPDGSSSILCGKKEAAIRIDWVTIGPGWNKPQLLTRFKIKRHSKTWDHFLIAEMSKFEHARKKAPRKMVEIFPAGLKKLRYHYCFSCEDELFFRNRLNREMRRSLDSIKIDLIIADSHEITCWLEGFVRSPVRLQSIFDLLWSLQKNVDGGLEELRRKDIRDSAPDGLSKPWLAVSKVVGGKLVRDWAGRPLILIERLGRLLSVSLRNNWQHGDLSTHVQTESSLSGHLRLKVEFGEVTREEWMLTTGDPAFDNVFHVQTNDTKAALCWLGRKVRQAILEVQLVDYRPEYTIELESGRVLLTNVEVETDFNRLKAAIRVATELGRRGEVLLREWTELASTLGIGVAQRSGALWSAEGGVALVSGEVAVDLLVCNLVKYEPILMTRVKAPRRVMQGKLLFCEKSRCDHVRLEENHSSLRKNSSLPKLLAHKYSLFTDDPQLVETLVEERKIKLLQSSFPTVLRIDHEAASLFFEGMVCDEKRLRPAIQLIDELRHDLRRDTSAGPYR